MFEAERGDDGHIGGHGARGVQSTAKAGLQQHDLRLLVGSNDQGHEQGRFKERQGDVRPRGHGVNAGEGFVEGGRGNRCSVESYALFHPNKVGRREGDVWKAGRREGRPQRGDRGPFPVASRHVDGLVGG